MDGPQTSTIQLQWFEGYFASTFNLQGSLDGTTWTPLFSEANGAIGTYEKVFAPATARYVRLNLTKNAKSNYRVIYFYALQFGAERKVHRLMYVK